MYLHLNNIENRYLSTVILTIGIKLQIRFFSYFGLKYVYQILTKEGGLIDKGRNNRTVAATG